MGSFSSHLPQTPDPLSRFCTLPGSCELTITNQDGSGAIEAHDLHNHSKLFALKEFNCMSL